MTFVLSRIAVDDYESWKSMFDAGRDTVRSRAKGHRILRNVEDPRELIIQVEFGSAEDAREAREQLLASGALEKVTLKAGPTITEVAEALEY